MSRSCLVVRVFTRDGVGGNHLGIVEDLSGLDGDKMQAIASNLGFSETVFIADGEVPFARIFTPEMELPFAGHPLVGAAWLMLGKESRSTTRLRCGIGEVHIRGDNDIVWVDVPMTPTNARIDETSFAGDVGLSSAMSSWRVDMPLDYRMVELPTVDDVSRIRPDTAAFGDAHGLTVFARTRDRVRMRFFIPEAGIEEDPATGSAAVALATMMSARGEEAGRLTIDQGEEIGHPSRINLRWAENRVYRRDSRSGRSEGVGHLSLLIDVEVPGDEDAIRRLNIVAFDGRTEEADLVDALRGAGDLLLSLVARQDGRVIAHVAFSRVTIEAAAGPVGGVALAPVAVQPELQGGGIGRELIETGLQRLTQLGEILVLVVGNPAYYTRFGFSVEQGEAFPCEYSGPYFLALRLGDTDKTTVGPVLYPEAFELVN